MTAYAKSNPRRSGNRPGQAERYNRKHYTKTTFRYRTESELAEHIAMYQDYGDMSINLLLTRLLCDYFKIPMPNKRMDTHDRITMYPLELAPLDGTWGVSPARGVGV